MSEPATMCDIGEGAGPEETALGGMFGLAEPSWIRAEGPLPSFLARNALFLANARSGIAILAECLKPHRIWLPSYLCDVILEALEHCGSAVELYNVDGRLEAAPIDWLDSVHSGDLVLFIDYFGFPCARAPMARAKQRGAWVLEDACQALLTTGVGRLADFVLFSPRKFLGVPDGGILALHSRTDLESIELRPPPSKWWLTTLAASLGRRDHDRSPGGGDWFSRFQETEKATPVGRYSMSELTKLLLRHCVDYDHVAQKRRANYRVLLDNLAGLAVFPRLDEGVVPLGFPIAVSNRDQVQQELFSRRIFPPIHWPTPAIVGDRFRTSRELASRMLTLPCDQRYTEHEMEHMAKVVLGEAA